MALRIRFRDGSLAGRVLEFADDVAEIRFGRNPDTCQVVFPPDDARVSREHFALRRVLGQYRLVTNRESVVLLDGKHGHDDAIVESMSEIRLGARGPKLIVEIVGIEGFVPTDGPKERVAGAHTQLKEVSRSASRLRTLATVSAGILLVAVVSGWFGYSWARTAIAGTRADFEKLNVDVLQKEDKWRETFAPIAQRVRKSVYLVMRRFHPSNDRACEPIGTAWVVAPGTLATNSHVAKAFEDLVADETLVVRSGVGGKHEFHVTKAVRHPGFDAFNELAEKSPWMIAPVDSKHYSGAEMPACDVALLYVEPKSASDLGPPLERAGDETVRALAPGAPLAFIGFPMEGFLQGGLSVSMPLPTFQQGVLTGSSGFLFETVDPSDAQLVHFNMPAAGGASGSPVFNADGKVVAMLNAGNAVSIGRLPRLPIGGVSYGQRIDVLSELIDDKAAARVPARVEAWKRQFADTTSRGVETSFGRLEHSVEAQMHKKLELLATHDDVKVHGVGLANATEIPFELPTDGAYVAVAVALAPIPLIAVGVSSSGEIQSGTDNKRPFASAKVAGAARSKFVFLIARASDEAMTAEQEAQLPDVACSVRIYRAKD